MIADTRAHSNKLLELAAPLGSIPARFEASQSAQWYGEERRRPGRDAAEAWQLSPPAAEAQRMLRVHLDPPVHRRDRQNRRKWCSLPGCNRWAWRTADRNRLRETERSEPILLRLHKCDHCRQACYCSRYCQLSDWPAHRPLCFRRGV
jgi:hypothetical protein